MPRDSFVPRLAEAILTLARDPDLAWRLGEAEFAKVRSEFDWEEKVDRMVALHREVITEA